MKPRFPLEVKVGKAKALCVAPDLRAAEAGAEMLRLGGNAFDAAAAAGFVEAVISPSNCGIGGYGATGIGFVASRKELVAIDANTTAPKAARSDLFPIRPTRDPNGYKLLSDSHRKGPLSVGVPGVLAGLVLMAERWGKLGRKQVMAPAIAEARKGLSLTPGQVLVWLTMKAESEGSPPPERSKLPKHLPMDDLAATLEAVAEQGDRVFYEGKIGRAIADDLQKRGGILTLEDMAAYRAEVVKPLGASVGNHRLVGPPPSSGSLTAIQMAALLDRLGRHDRAGSPEAFEALIEVAKVAWVDRLTTLGDFRSMPVSPETYLADSHFDELLSRVKSGLKHPEPGRIVAPDPLRGTVHLAAADAEGNVVAWTQTHGGGFGSGLMIKGTGVVLGHGMCRFEPRPGWANSIAPGKRPLHNMCPVLILKDGQAVGAIGAAGGRTIVNNVAYLASLHLLQGQNAAESVLAPRAQVETMEPVVLERSANPDVATTLKQRGHDVKEAARDAGMAHMILREGDLWTAAAEPRSGTAGVATAS